MYAGTEAAAVFGLVGYFILSLASSVFLVIWLGFRQIGVDVLAIHPGPLYWTNLLTLLALAGLLGLLPLAGLLLPGRKLGKLSTDHLGNGMPIIGLCLAFGLVAIVFGMPALIGEMIAAAR